MASLDSFYLSLLKAWYNIKLTLLTSSFSLQTLKEMPLLGSVIVNKNEIKILPEWNNCRFSKLGQLLSPQGMWTDPQLQDFSPSLQRRLKNNYILIKNYFQQKIIPQQDQEQPIRFKFSIAASIQVKIFPGTKKQNYNASLQPSLVKPEVTGKCVWLDKQFFWNNLYTYPTDKRDSDVAWRLLHNALVTPRRLYQWKIIPSSLCPWCKQEGNLSHMFFQCQQTKQIWKLVSRKLAQINESPLPTHEKLLTGYQRKTSPAKLSNFILTLAKSTIYRSYMSVIKEDNPTPPCYLKIFKSRLKYRITLEQHYANIMGSQEKFQETFLINNALINIDPT